MTARRPSLYHRLLSGVADRIVADLPGDQRPHVREVVISHLRTELRHTLGVGRVELYVPSADAHERHDLQEAMRRALEAGQPAALVARKSGKSFRSVYAYARRLRGRQDAI